jgi:hypothetical protein
MSDISVALGRIRSLERAVQTPYSGDAVAFMQVLSGHLEGGSSAAPAQGTLTQTPASETDLEASDLLRLDGVLRSRFLAPGATGTTALAGAGSGRLLRPVDGSVTSSFGEREHPVTGEHKHHDGLDLAAPQGTPIRAAEGGVVSFAGRQGGYGNVVVVDHPGARGRVPDRVRAPEPHRRGGGRSRVARRGDRRGRVDRCVDRPPSAFRGPQGRRGCRPGSLSLTVSSPPRSSRRS